MKFDARRRLLKPGSKGEQLIAAARIKLFRCNPRQDYSAIDRQRTEMPAFIERRSGE